MSAPRWDIRLANSKSYLEIEGLNNASNKQLSLALNKPGSFSFDVPIDSSVAQKLETIKTCVKVYRNAQLVWSGPIWSIEDSTPENKTKVNAIGWLELLNHRLITEDLFYENRIAGNIGLEIFEKSFKVITPNISIPNPSFDTDLAGWSAVIVDPGTEILSFNRTNDIYDTSPASALVSIQNAPSAKLIKLTSPYFSGFNFEAGVTYFLKFSAKKRNGDVFTFYFGQEYVDESFDLTTGTENFNEFISSWTPSSTIAASNVNLRVFVPMDNIDNLFYIDSLVLTEKLQDIPIYSGEFLDVIPRTKSYTSLSNVGQEIQNLSEIEAGFDYSIDVQDRKLNMYSFIGEEKDVFWGYNTGQNNLAQISKNTDASTVVNNMYVTGKNVTALAVDDFSQSNYGIFAESESISDVSDDLIVEAFANAEVAIRSEPRQTVNFVPLGSGPSYIPQPFTDYNIGDIVKVSADKGRLKLQNKKVRIFAMNISIDNNGVEKVSSIQTAYSS